MAFSLTLVTSERPAILAKDCRVGLDGALAFTPVANLTRGGVEVIEVADLAEFSAVLAGLRPSQALVFGVPKDRDAKVLVTERDRERNLVPGAIARTLRDFEWPAGPGLMMIDYDPLPDRAPLDRDGLVAALRAAVPMLRAAEMVWFPSASSHVCRVADGVDLTGLRGQRLYVPVADARDIPRAGRVLIGRLWLGGQGVMRVSASGQFLPRTLVDATIWQPNRLDFASGASTGPGLEQRRGQPLIVSAE